MIVTTRKSGFGTGPVKSPSLRAADDDSVIIRIKDLIVEVGLGPDTAIDRASALGGSRGRVVVIVHQAHTPGAGVTRVFTEFEPR
jgi:hypothetical protein